LPLAESTKVTLAPEINAPDGSFTVPRSEVLAFWLNAKAAQERMQKGNRLQWKILTSSSRIARVFCLPLIAPSSVQSNPELRRSDDQLV
jgi:hypothetical protein